MAKNGVNLELLQQQKQVLVNVFTDLATSMRRAADEAQNYAAMIASADPSSVDANLSTKLAFQQRNNAELSKIIQQNAPGGFASSYMPLHTPISPASDQHTPDLDIASTTNGKKRPRASQQQGVPSAMGAPRKKEKKIKDPLAPKRPASAYILYQNDVRKAMVEKHPELSYREVLVEISKQWSELAPAQKQSYQQKVEQGKVVYEQQKAQYDRNHPNGGSSSASGIIATPSPVQHIAAVPPPTGVPHPSVAALPAAVTAAVTNTSASSDADSDDDEEDQVQEQSGSDDDESDEDSPPAAKKHKSSAGPPQQQQHHMQLPGIASMQNGGRF